MGWIKQGEGITNQESRRTFIRKALTGTAVIANTGILGTIANSETGVGKPASEIPWYKRAKRWGQTNITEHDPEHYDIGWWRNHWKATQIQGVIVNAGGIVAYYPSRVPLHRPAQYLAGRDLFGELCHAAHEDGLVVFARMDSNRAHEEFYKAHPDWFAIDSRGDPYKASELFVSCINGPYYNEHIPSILGEIIKLYHPDGFTDNSWSGLGRDKICYCENCKRNFHEKTGKDIPESRNWDNPVFRDWIKWNYARRLEIWDLNNRTTKTAGGNDCIWSGMNSGSVAEQCRSFRDFREICKRADIIMLDSQARSDSGGFQQNACTGKLIHGLLGWDKLVPESMAMYQAGSPVFRLASKPEPEARMWMTEGIAGGIQPWWHYVGASHEDRRIYKTAGPVFNWHKANEQFLVNREPVATVGVVWSQQNMDFYGREETEQKVEDPWRGITQALMRARIPYVPVHADHIYRESGRLSLLILPNLGVMTEAQVAAVRHFVEKGGNLIATGESSLYDEWGDRRPDYALGNLFGVHKADRSADSAEVKRWPGDTYHTYLRLTQATGERHPVFRGFDETDILAFGGLLEPVSVDTGADVLMTFIPPFPIYPPETAWMKEPKTNIPGLVVNTTAGGGRIAFLLADLDTQFGRYNLPDHGNLIANTVRWAVKDNIPVKVECTGLLDCNLYRQDGRMIMHVVNLTSAGTWRQPVDELIPVGPVKISISLPPGIRGEALQLAVSEKVLTFKRENDWFIFTLNSIMDHEVAIIT